MDVDELKHAKEAELMLDKCSATVQNVLAHPETLQEDVNFAFNVLCEYRTRVVEDLIQTNSMQIPKHNYNQPKQYELHVYFEDKPIRELEADLNCIGNTLVTNCKTNVSKIYEDPEILSKLMHDIVNQYKDKHVNYNHYNVEAVNNETIKIGLRSLNVMYRKSLSYMHTILYHELKKIGTTITNNGKLTHVTTRAAEMSHNNSTSIYNVKTDIKLLPLGDCDSVSVLDFLPTTAGKLKSLRNQSDSRVLYIQVEFTEREDSEPRKLAHYIHIVPVDKSGYNIHIMDNDNVVSRYTVPKLEESNRISEYSCMKVLTSFLKHIELPPKAPVTIDQYWVDYKSKTDILFEYKKTEYEDAAAITIRQNNNDISLLMSVQYCSLVDIQEIHDDPVIPDSPHIIHAPEQPVYIPPMIPGVAPTSHVPIRVVPDDFHYNLHHRPVPYRHNSHVWRPRTPAHILRKQQTPQKLYINRYTHNLDIVLLPPDGLNDSAKQNYEDHPNEYKYYKEPKNEYAGILQPQTEFGDVKTIHDDFAHTLMPSLSVWNTDKVDQHKYTELSDVELENNDYLSEWENIHINFEKLRKKICVLLDKKRVGDREKFYSYEEMVPYLACASYSKSTQLDKDFHHNSSGIYRHYLRCYPRLQDYWTYLWDLALTMLYDHYNSIQPFAIYELKHIACQPIEDYMYWYRDVNFEWSLFRDNEEFIQVISPLQPEVKREIVVCKLIFDSFYDIPCIQGHFESLCVGLVHSIVFANPNISPGLFERLIMGIEVEINKPEFEYTPDHMNHLLLRQYQVCELNPYTQCGDIQYDKYIQFLDLPVAHKFTGNTRVTYVDKGNKDRHAAMLVHEIVLEHDDTHDIFGENRTANHLTDIILQNLEHIKDL